MVAHSRIREIRQRLPRFPLGRRLISQLWPIKQSPHREVLSRFSSGLIRAIFAMREIMNGPTDKLASVGGTLNTVPLQSGYLLSFCTLWLQASQSEAPEREDFRAAIALKPQPSAKISSRCAGGTSRICSSADFFQQRKVGITEVEVDVSVDHVSFPRGRGRRSPKTWSLIDQGRLKILSAFQPTF